MKKLVAVLPLFLLAGCALHKSHPCVVTPVPAIVKATPAPVVETPAPAVVTPAPAPVIVAATPVPAPVDYAALFKANVKDIYFDFDKSAIRADQKATLAANVAFLKANPNVLFSLVSSCDVVGTDKYNDGLGQLRVEKVAAALAAAGIDASRFNASTLGKTNSYGKDHQSNRRVHFAFSGVR